MPKKKSAAAAEPSPAAAGKTKHQTFDYQEIPRSSIKEAPYNPRQINAYQRKNLMKTLEEYGCVEPLVWNKRTGLLVSGHQRLSILDDLEGKPDYTIGMSVIDIDPKREKKLNVLLNNKQAQGDFTKDGLMALLQDGDIQLSDIAMTRADLEFEFGDLPELDEIVQGLEASKKEKPKAGAKKLSEAVGDIRQEGEERPESDSEYYVLVAFDTADECEAWLVAHQFDAEARHLSIGEMTAAIESDVAAARKKRA